ncbi:MAG: hypothetical protein QOH96_170 [Blastocatellia bacterium]|nr:hypothetical protein [Blastocatellia bacterium]
MCSHQELIVIIRRSFVTTIAFRDDQECVIVFFHFAVRKAASAAKLGAADLEPDKIIGMVNDAHLVCFGISYADYCFEPVIKQCVIIGRAHVVLYLRDYRRGIVPIISHK